MHKDSYSQDRSLVAAAFTAPPTPEYTDHPASFDPSTTTTTSTYRFCDSRASFESEPTVWHSSRGLGVDLPSSTQSCTYAELMRERSAMEDNYHLSIPQRTVPSQYRAYDNYHKRHQTETPLVAEEMWTMIPQQQVWQNEQHSYEPSYCHGSIASSVSSPFTPHAQIIKSQASPIVKQEPSPDVKDYANWEDQEIAVYDHSHVRPTDLVTNPPYMVPFAAYTPFMTPVTPHAILSPPSPEYDPSHSSYSASEDLSYDSNSRKRKRSATKTAHCHCEECGAGFQRSSNLRMHMHTHDEGREPQFTCPFDKCGRGFHRRTDMQRHQKSVSATCAIDDHPADHLQVHNKIKDHGCELCGREFARKDTLERYVKLRQSHSQC